MTRWHRSHRFDPAAVELADRHYSRQQPGSAQFVAPGRCVVLLTRPADALWVSLWQISEAVQHEWPDAWVCSLFRNEGSVLSSILIHEAIAATRAAWGDPPIQGFVTFVDASAVRSENPGCCFKHAGFQTVGKTRKRGRIVLQLKPENFPPPRAAGAHLVCPGQGVLFGSVS